MTGTRIAVCVAGLVASLGTIITGLILSAVPALASDGTAVPAINQGTPITFGLVTAGISVAAVTAWKVSAAWTKMETTMARFDERLKALETNK